MKLILDEKKCLKKNLTLQETLIVAAISMGNYNQVLQNLINRNITDGNKLQTPWEDITNELLGLNEEEHLKMLASQMQQCFPRDKVPGTAYYYRCNTREIILKLKKFFEIYGEYPDDKIINATKKFIASFRGDYRFLPLIKYFILKNKKEMDETGEFHVTETSELATTLENLTDDEEIPSMEESEDWLVNSRN